jgi:hypothetical protein
VLSLLLRAGVSEATLPTLAVLINAMLHLGSAVIVGAIAAELWRSRAAGLLAGALFAAYPVALYFVADVSDTTLGIFLMLSGLRAAQRVLAGPPGRIGVAIECGLLLGLAVLVRPQLVAVACMVLALAVLGAVRGWVATRSSIAGAAGLALPLLAMALINLHLGGVALVLPWQGAHALYASNGPEANGRHFAQTREIALTDQRANPARVEAELIYSEATGRRALDDLGAFNAYWTGRTLQHIGAQPLQWLALLGSKARYLFNDFEQYTNRGYDFHVQRMPWLRASPLSFGVLLVLAMFAVLAAPPAGTGRWILLGAGLGLVAILLLTLIGDRHRMPLLPLLAVAAGGLAVVRGAPSRRWMSAIAGAALVAILAWWPVPAGMRDESRTDDHLQMASALLNLGQSSEALMEVDQALALQPTRAWGHSLSCSAAYNRYLASLPARTPDPTLLADARDRCAVAGNPQARFTMAMLAHQACAPEQAAALLAGVLGGAEVELRHDACRMLEHLQRPDAARCSGLADTGGGPVSTILEGRMVGVDERDALRSVQLVAPPWCEAIERSPAALE